jgi:hypothetical protein
MSYLRHLRTVVSKTYCVVGFFVRLVYVACFIEKYTTLFYDLHNF